jgi:ribosomal protein L25 (general stress protein Ctc)
MLTLSAKIRKELGKKVKVLKKKGILPGVLYGPKVESQPLEVDLKEFEKAFEEAGESSLISLNFGSKKHLVMIHAIEIDPLTQKPIHVDFYQPRLDQEITVPVPLVFEGEALAEKTYNPRLGIKGGISIIGTTGIVEPKSINAYRTSLSLQLGVFFQGLLDKLPVCFFI